MRYADRTAVLYQLNQLDENEPNDTEDIALAESIEASVALRLDEAMNRSFGVAPVAETRVLSAYGAPVMTLTWGAVSVMTVTTGGEWDGASWNGATTVPSTGYQPWHVDQRGRIWGLRWLSGIWDGIYRVTAIWADQSTLDIPKDLVDAATFITVNQFRMQKMSPAGQEGPDGLMSQPRNPWAYEDVKRTIARLRVPRLVV